jgi:hypothetical protein
MIQLLGWICTILVLIGYWLNANGKYSLAMFTWIAGDLGWIVYDYFIDNWSHATLSTIIILINIYGVKRIRNRFMSQKKINKISEELFS